MSGMRRLAAVVAVGLGFSLSTAATGATPAALEPNTYALPEQGPDRVLPPRRATIIGDSAMAGVRWNEALSGLRGFDPDDRLESCRRLVDRSCNGREGRRPNTALVEVGLLPTPLASDVLVLAVGYNDFDTLFAVQSRQVLGAAVAKGYQTIAWVTYRENVTYLLPGDTNRAASNYRNMNAELRALVASGHYPQLTLWDLNGYSSGASQWFTTDGVHQQTYASWLVADWLSRKMASLDGRPCPVRWTPTYPTESVCPDPNVARNARGYPSIGLLYDF